MPSGLVSGHSATDGVGFEDNVLFVAMEGSSECGTGNCGTVQVLDVDSGDWYTLPHLSVRLRPV